MATRKNDLKPGDGCFTCQIGEIQRQRQGQVSFAWD